MLAFHNGASVASLQKGWLLFLDGVYIYRDNLPLDRPDPRLERVAKANGFSLHAGVSCEGHQSG
jgi:hypothetical protein